MPKIRYGAPFGDYPGGKKEAQKEMNMILQAVGAELATATVHFHPFSSDHEGYAVLLEEVDELWEEIKQNGETEDVELEAIQIAAVAVRFVLDRRRRNG